MTQAQTSDATIVFVVLRESTRDVASASAALRPRSIRRCSDFALPVVGYDATSRQFGEHGWGRGC